MVMGLPSLQLGRGGPDPVGMDVVIFFETGSGQVDQAGLELMPTPLPQPVE